MRFRRSPLILQPLALFLLPTLCNSILLVVDSSRQCNDVIVAPNSTLATPDPISDSSLTSLKEKLIKIGAKIVRHGRYVTFQMAEVAVPRQCSGDLRLIAELRPKPPPAPA